MKYAVSDEGVPVGLITDLLDVVGLASSSTAVHATDGTSTTTWSELWQRSDALLALLAADTTSGDLVAVCLPTGATFVVAYLALLRLGRPMVLASPGVDDDTLAGLGVTHRLDTEGLHRRCTSACSWLEGHDEIAVVLFTSGTTGRPRAVVLDEGALAWSVWNTASVADEVMTGHAERPADRHALLADLGSRFRSGLRFASGMPAHTVAGLTVLNRALLLDDELVVGPFSASAFCDAIERGRCTNVGLSAMMARQLLREWTGGLYGTAPTQLLALGLGGGSIAPALASQLESVFGCLVTVGYGSTELGGVALMSRPSAPRGSRHGSVGAPLPAVDIQLLDETVSPDGTRTGQLQCHSPAQAIGHVDGGRLVPFHRWIDTGDLAVLRPSGEVDIVGRRDHVILRGGRRIDPSRVEAILEEHPSVRRAAVGGVPSRVAGESDIAALIVPRSPIDASTLRRHCVDHLDRWEIPRSFIAIDELPMCEDGYLRRGALVAHFEAATTNSSFEPT